MPEALHGASGLVADTRVEGARVAAPRRPSTTTAGILATGHALPPRVVSNEAIAGRLGIDAGWIERRTGIAERRHAEPGARVSDLAAEAGRAALESAGIAAGEIDLVLVATLAPDELTPNTAPAVAHALGTHAGAMDVGAACSGFLSGLALGCGQIESGRAERVLLVGAEILSRWLDLDDRGTATVFGDAAGAVVLGRGDGEVGPIVLRSAGEHAALIRASHEDGLIRMQGHETFLVAVDRLAWAAVEACRASRLALDEVDLFVFHQANARILRAVGEKLDLPADRVVNCIETLGNTSAASIPTALSLLGDRLAPGARVLLGALGAGVTYGATVVTWGSA